MAIGTPVPIWLIHLHCSHRLADLASLSPFSSKPTGVGEEEREKGNAF
jgi:hypothetical protein